MIEFECLVILENFDPEETSVFEVGVPIVKDVESTTSECVRFASKNLVALADDSKMREWLEANHDYSMVFFHEFRIENNTLKASYAFPLFYEDDLKIRCGLSDLHVRSGAQFETYECPICMEKRHLVRVPCEKDHSVCAECVKKYSFKGKGYSCPICRKIFSEKKIK